MLSRGLLRGSMSRAAVAGGSLLAGQEAVATSSSSASMTTTPASLGSVLGGGSGLVSHQIRNCSGDVVGGGGGDGAGAWKEGGRKTFQPFCKQDEDDLVKVITTKPRHVLKHVRQLIWRSRKRELHFRNTVTQLMVTLQDFLRKELIEPNVASEIMEGVMFECVKLQQHDMAHLLFRAFLRFRKFGCTITIASLRSLFDSYKGTDNREMMSQLATEMAADPNLRAFCIAAHLYAGNIAEAEAMREQIAENTAKKQAAAGGDDAEAKSSTSEASEGSSASKKEELDTFTPHDMAAIVSGYDALGMDDKVTEFIISVSKLGMKPESYSIMFQDGLKVFYKKYDHKRFNKVLALMQEMNVPADSNTFATILRMKLQRAETVEDIYQVEETIKAMGYAPDITGNSIIIAAFARMNHFGDRQSEEIMLNKVDTLLSSIETRLAQGDADLDVSAQHLRAVIRGYGAAGRPELMKGAWQKLQHDGISNDTRVYNELLKWFALMGNVKDVLATKEEMITKDVHPDAVTYTWVFRALGKYYPRQSERLYDEMKGNRVRPDVSLYIAMVSVFGDLGNYERCEQLHADIRKREEAGTLPVSAYTYTQLIRVFSHDLDKVEALYKEAKNKSVADHSHILTTLMAAYAKSPGGDAKLEAMLSGVPQWTIEIYNCLLNLYGKQDKKEKVAELVERMEREGVAYDEVTFGTLVTSYGRWKDVAKLHTLIELLKSKEGQVSASFYAILAATYSRLGDTEGITDAWDDLLSSKLFPDTNVYNQFLQLYGKHSNVNQMQTVLDNMLKMVPPNPLTATTVVDMLGKSGRISDMEALLEDMSHSEDTAPTIVTYHQVMNAYAKTGDVIKMDRAHEQMKRKNMKDNMVTFNILADGYGRAKRFEALQDLLVRREEAKIPMDELGYCVLVSTYGRARMAAEVNKIADMVISDHKQFLADHAGQSVTPQGQSTVMTRKVIWALIDAFCRCQETRHMQRWIKELKTSDVTPKTDDATTAASTSAGGDEKKAESDVQVGDEANDASAEGPGADLSPKDQVTLINYFCRAGLLDEAEGLVKLSEKRGKAVPFSGLNALARAYARASRFDKVVAILHQMRDRKFVPDASTALFLSSAFVKAGLHEQAQQVVAWRRQYAKTHVDEAEDNIV